MLKLPLQIMVFALLCFCMIEMSYRVFSTGLVAFNPFRFNSLNILLLTDFVEPSPYEGIPYRLAPNIDSWFQGERFATNSRGMADREYSVEKPADTFRVAVVGSSWSMATAVVAEDNYHSVLERRLSGGGQNVEFLNFSVEYYGLRELVETARQVTPEWQPDALVVAITNFSSYMRWVEPGQDESMPARTYPFFQSFALRGLDQVLGSRRYARGLPKARPVLAKGETDLFNSQLLRAFRELAAIADEREIPLTVLWLAYHTPGGEIEAMLRAEADRLGIVFVEGYRVLGGAERAKLQSARFNKHPNREGHTRVADLLEQELRAGGILPKPSNTNRTEPTG